MIARRSFFAGLAALPFARLLEPLARWFKPAAAVVVENTRRAVFVGAEAARLAYNPALEAEQAYRKWAGEQRDRAFLEHYRNPATRVSVEGGPVLWEE